jgi:glyoxylase-like metal-dependent hydrolase (beta-lactamase superfamily II)
MTTARVIAHERAHRHLVDPARLWQASQQTLGNLALQYGSIDPVPEDIIIDAEDSMKLDLGRGLILEIYITPGHAPHHLSIFDRTNSVLIAGEAAGVCLDGAIRLATPPPFKLEETLASIDKLIALKPKSIGYGHFGCYDNAPERLSVARQQLLTWYEIVIPLARQNKSPEEILTVLRGKDPNLAYLDRLSQDARNREHALLINTINGLSGPAATA